MIDLDRTIQEIRKEEKQKAKIRLDRFKRENPLTNIEIAPLWVYSEDCPDQSIGGTLDFCVSTAGLCGYVKQILLREGILFVGDNKIEFHPEMAKYYTF